MDHTGHTVIAEWSAADTASTEQARTAFNAQLDEGYFAIATGPEGAAEQVRELPLEAPLVIMRRPIAGG